MHTYWLQGILIGICCLTLLGAPYHAQAVGGRADTQPEPAKNQPTAKPAAASSATNGGLDGYTFQSITQNHLLQGTDDPTYLADVRRQLRWCAVQPTYGHQPG